MRRMYEKFFMMSMTGKTVNLQWIPGQTANELADQLAKSALAFDSVNFCHPLALVLVRCFLTQTMETEIEVTVARFRERSILKGSST